MTWHSNDNDSVFLMTSIAEIGSYVKVVEVSGVKANLFKIEEACVYAYAQKRERCSVKPFLNKVCHFECQTHLF